MSRNMRRRFGFDNDGYIEAARSSRSRYPPMPDKFIPLATYNAERARGIMHERSWQAKMKDLQVEYNHWINNEGRVQISGTPTD